MSKGKLIKKTKFSDTPAEIRKADNDAIFVVLRFSKWWNRLFIIVAEDGYEHKYHTSEVTRRANNNIHISMNGAMDLTFEQYWNLHHEMQLAISAAQKYIRECPYEVKE